MTSDTATGATTIREEFDLDIRLIADGDEVVGLASNECTSDNCSDTSGDGFGGLHRHRL